LDEEEKMPIGNLSVGTFGPEVQALHSKLRQQGFNLPDAEVNRQFFGPVTRDTILDLQRKRGLKITGIADAATLDSLGGLAVSVSSGASAVSSNGTVPQQAIRSTTQSVPSQPASARGADYSARDNAARFTFYVPLWKRNGISLVDYDDYWRDVHGPVCARLPGQFQYWQFHVAHNDSYVFPTVPGVDFKTAPDDQFDGIAELTFETDADRQSWFQAAGILMDDEQNIFRKAIGYVTDEGNSRTYVDGIEIGDPNGSLGVLKYHVMVKQAAGVSIADFRRYMRDTFASNLARHPAVLKLRLHLLEPPDTSRPDAAGVVHIEPPEKQYQAAYEIAFRDKRDQDQFFASPEYAAAVKDMAHYVRQVSPFPERTAYAFVYNGRMTTAGQRGSRTAELISKLGARNQLQPDIIQLMVGQPAPNTQVATSAPGSAPASGATAVPPPAPVLDGKRTPKPTLAQIYSTPIGAGDAPSNSQQARYFMVDGKQAKILPPDGGRRFKPSPGEDVFFKMGGSETEGRFDYFEIRVGHLEGPPLHIHMIQDETFHVLEGELSVKVGDELIACKAGDFLFIPKGTVHTYVNLKEQRARAVGNLSPGGFDDFVAELSAYQRSVPKSDQRIVDEISAKHNQKQVGPPLAVSMGLRQPH
jgi:mannose-6-phosphate isomerase-like protein (cupin superfamily)